MLLGMFAYAWGGLHEATHPLRSTEWGSWRQFSQQEAGWCWAAAAQMMVDRVHGSAPTQCTLVRRGKGVRTCRSGVGTMGDLATALRRSNVPIDDVRPGVPDFATIRLWTTSGGGILVRVEHVDGSHGHVAPVIGSSARPDRVYITYIRTSGVSGSWVDYSQFAAGTAGLGFSTYTVTHYLGGGGG